MKIYISLLLGSGHREVLGSLNAHGFADTCRDDKAVMDCIDLVAQEACAAMTEIEQESCRVTCKTCQTSNCIDTLDDDGCIKLVRSHAIKPCKQLDFNTRFQCRATCGICQEATMEVPIHLKGIRDLGNLETPAPDAQFFKPPRGDTADIHFPGDDHFEYGNSYLINEYDDETDVKLDQIPDIHTDIDIGNDLAYEEAPSLIKPNPKNVDKNAVGDQFFHKGISLPQYLLIIVCIGVGLLLWIFAWIGWSCRKCCHARKERDQIKIKEGILGTRDISHRLQSDPLPIPTAITEGFKHSLTPEAAVECRIPSSRFASSHAKKTTSQEMLVNNEGTSKHSNSSRDWPLPQANRHESCGSSYPPESDGYSIKQPERSQREKKDHFREEKERKNRLRQGKTGYGHRRDTQKSEKSTKTKSESPEPESGFGDSDNDVNKLLKYHQSLQKQSQSSNHPNQSKHHDALMFIAKDLTLDSPVKDTISIDMPPLVNKLSPEDSRNMEINEMIKNANNTIQFDHTEAVQDITIMPLKNKTVSLGRPVFPGSVSDSVQPPAYSPSKTKKEKKERRPSPLANWAAVANANEVELERNVHEQTEEFQLQQTEREIQIKEIQKMKKYAKRNQKGQSASAISDKAMKDQGRKINAIKKRIDDIEAAAAMTDSDMNLSDLSD